jgi:hypothetical protein
MNLKKRLDKIEKKINIVIYFLSCIFGGMILIYAEYIFFRKTQICPPIPPNRNF